MNIPIKLKDKLSCNGCPIYSLNNVFETRECPLINITIKHRYDGTAYGNPVRPEDCIKRLGE